MHDDRWVPAAPFRAHLSHVASATNTAWPIIALHAGLPLGLVHDLLDTRPGRRVHRIAPELARRVFGINEETIRRLARAQVPARTSRQTVHRLVAAGWTQRGIALRLHLSISEVDALAGGALPEVTALLELRLAALLATAERPTLVRRPSLAA